MLVASPAVSDVHEVENALTDRVSIGVHVYRASTGAVSRHTFDPVTGTPSPFVSGHSTQSPPNFWDRSADVRAPLAS